MDPLDKLLTKFNVWLRQQPEYPLLFLADVKQTGQDLTVQPIPCRFKIPEVKLRGQQDPIVLTASDALVQSVKVPSTAARIDVSPNGFANEQYFSFSGSANATWPKSRVR